MAKPEVWTDEVVETLEVYLRRGYSATECANIINKKHGLDVTRSSVTAKAQRNNIHRGVPSIPAYPDNACDGGL